MSSLFSRIATSPDGSYMFVDASPFDLLRGKGAQPSADLLKTNEKLRPIIDAAADTGVPLWLAFAGETAALADASVPVEGRVAEITEQTDAFVVSLEPSELPRVLRKSNSRLDEILAALQAAREAGSEVLIAETDDHEIEDVSTPFGGAANLLNMEIDGENKADAADKTDLAEKLADMQQNDALRLFNQVAGQTCRLPLASSGCIPFLYPDDGCWARAHQMCRVFTGMGATSGKIWIYGKLSVRTKNNPRCSVGWTYHVAPRVNVAGKGEYVIDPSMFDGPVPVKTWISAQNDALAREARTAPDVYYRPSSGTNLEYDRTYTKTAGKLERYRVKLVERAVKQGAPPYANCRP